MATRQYIGARYVPKFYDYNGSPNWRAGIEYESLIIVTRNGNSYTSKKPVPSNIGAPENNPEYWVATGLYNEQVEAYRQLVIALSDRVDDAIDDIDEAINNVNEEYKIENGKIVSPFLGSLGAVDFAGNIQGGYSIDNTLYQYITNGSTGHFRKIDLSTGAINGTEGSTVQYYHGNDFCVKNNVLYCAPYDNGANEGNNKLIYGTPDGNTVNGELDIFSDTGLTCLYGVCDYENNEILCALRMFGTNTVNSTRLFAYDVVTQQKREITVDWGEFNYSVNSFPHPIIYVDGILYLTASFENGIYSIIISGDTAKVVSYCGLEKVNSCNIPFAELESVFLSDRFGKNTLIVGGTTIGNAGFTYNTINLKGVEVNSLIERDYTPNFDINEIYYDPSSTNMFELGTSTYPFKKFKRAFCMTGVNNRSLFGTINIHMPSECNERIDIIGANVGLGGNCIYNGIVSIVRSEVTFGNDNTFNAGVFMNANCKCVFGAYCIFNGGVTCDRSYVEFRVAYYRSNVTVTGGVVFLSSANQDDITGRATEETLLIMNRTTKPESFSIGGGTTLLTSGVK